MIMNMFLEGETTQKVLGGSPMQNAVRNDANKTAASDYDCVKTVLC